MRSTLDIPAQKGVGFLGGYHWGLAMLYSKLGRPGRGSARGQRRELSEAVVRQAAVILSSYRRWIGSDLLPPQKSPDALAQSLFDAPFVVISHGTEEDPVLNYGNRTALTLWELSWEEFTKMPSRSTAEPMEQAERARLLDEVSRKGFMEGYQGVRISKTGRRFRVEKAVVWNLVDGQDRCRGQAATFSRWTYL